MKDYRVAGCIVMMLSLVALVVEIFTILLSMWTTPRFFTSTDVLSSVISVIILILLVGIGTIMVYDKPLA